jgi:hypothetical protein
MHGVKIGSTTTEEHLFCRNLADQLVDCKHKEYQVKLETTPTKLSTRMLEIDSCKHRVKIGSTTTDEDCSCNYMIGKLPDSIYKII